MRSGPRIRPELSLQLVDVALGDVGGPDLVDEAFLVDEAYRAFAADPSTENFRKLNGAWARARRLRRKHAPTADAEAIVRVAVAPWRQP